MRDVVIVAELGPNPAPVCELVWALARQRGLRAREAFLLTNDQGEHYLHELQDGLELLGEVLDALPWRGVHTTRVRDAAGAPVDDELSAADSEVWSHARWEHFRRAIRAAGERPVVFGLVGGRRRTMTALTAAMFQLLARPDDLCVDVRVSEPRVEGARAGFYFPEQRALCADERGLIDPASVEVMLVELRLPRLRRLLREHDLRTYEQALVATGVALAGAVLPRLRVDVPARRVEIDGVPVPLSEGQLTWYAALALARVETPHGWVASTEHDALLRRVLLACAAGRAGWRPRSSKLRLIHRGEDVAYDELRKLKADTRRALRVHCRAQGLARQDLVIPQTERHGGEGWRQRIALPGEHITVVLES